MIKPRSIAFIPARSGSKRVPNKNIQSLNGHPLLAYSVCSAIESEVYDAVVCVTDSPLYADIAHFYGAEVPFLRPEAISGDNSPDIDWVIWALESLKMMGREYEIFSILRPTSPFRLPETIRRAWKLFNYDASIDSLRAVEKCKQHPGKMWVIRGGRMLPLMPFSVCDVPWHSSQYPALPEIYSQDASLEIAWSSTALEKHTIAGEVILPFLTNGLEGFDINRPEDWLLAEHYLNNGDACLQNISKSPYIFKD